MNKKTINEALQYHSMTNTPLTENIFRAGSLSYFETFCYARKLLKEGKINLNNDDRDVLKNTDIGKWGIYENSWVPLDFPMLSEQDQTDVDDPSRIVPYMLDGKPTRNSEGMLIHPTVEGIRNFWRWFGDSKVVDSMGRPLVVYHGTARDFQFFKTPVKWFSRDTNLSNTYAMFRGDQSRSSAVYACYLKISNAFNSDVITKNSVTVADFFSGLLKQSGGKHKEELYKLLKFVKRCAKREESGPYFSVYDFWYDNKSYFGTDGARAIFMAIKLSGFDGIYFVESGASTYGVFDNRHIKSAIGNSGKFSSKTGTITEAEYQGRKVELNKPKRNTGSGKKYMVYVKDPKSGNVRKITFGDLKGGLTAKTSDPEARKRFAARHDCENKNDKTKPGYWACRLPRYAKSLGISASGKWW
jgi:hypothetical protein